MIAVAVAGTADQMDKNRSMKNMARDAARNAENERLKAETEAAQKASAQTQMARRALAKNSLFTGGGTAGGMTTLGVG